MSFQVVTAEGLNFRAALSGTQTVAAILATVPVYDEDLHYVTDADGQRLQLADSVEQGTQLFLRENAEEEATTEGSELSVLVELFGKSEVELTVPFGTSVADVISKSGFDASGKEIFVNNQPSTNNTLLSESPSRVSLIGRVKGGC